MLGEKKKILFQIQWQKDFFVCNQTTNTTPKQAKPIVVVSSGVAFEHWTSIVQGAREKNLQQCWKRQPGHDISGDTVLRA